MSKHLLTSAPNIFRPSFSSRVMPVLVLVQVTVLEALLIKQAYSTMLLTGEGSGSG